MTEDDFKMTVTRESWQKLQPGDRDWLLYNSLQDIDNRLKKIENRAIYHKVSSFLGGFMGGVVGFFSSKYAGRP